MRTGSNFFLKIAMALFIVFAIVLIVQLQLEFNTLRQDKEEIEEEIRLRREEIAELHYELELPMDEEYILRVARKKLKYYPYDVIVFFNDIGSAGNQSDS